LRTLCSVAATFPPQHLEIQTESETPPVEPFRQLLIGKFAQIKGYGEIPCGSDLVCATCGGHLTADNKRISIKFLGTSLLRFQPTI